MAETNQNFEVFQGDNKEVTFTVKDESGTNLNCTGYTLRWVMYDDDEVILIDKNSPTDLDLGVQNYQVVLSLSPSDTLNIEEGFYPHELEITSPLGNVSTVATGLVKVSYSKA